MMPCIAYTCLCDRTQITATAPTARLAASVATFIHSKKYVVWSLLELEVAGMKTTPFVTFAQTHCKSVPTTLLTHALEFPFSYANHSTCTGPSSCW